MKLAVLVAVLLIVGAVVATVARRRSVDDPSRASDLDAEAEANRWVVRLGGSLAGIDVRAQARAGGGAAESLTDATERLRTARAQLTTARTPDEYARVTRTAVEGLRHVREARAALGMDAGSIAGSASGSGSEPGGGSGGGGQGSANRAPVTAHGRRGGPRLDCSELPVARPRRTDHDHVDRLHSRTGAGPHDPRGGDSPPLARRHHG
ncbi:hypothetical protein [Streptomyces sp. MB09-02B]|uniref:hypothetical protein n=1 Tax=Streptomyces sp. MB09-02B TaxID=3028667 RepID=UPI0029A0661C|nr:hypothetical protein [Streptomyces sp. MB09-02B]MDX3638828.1 hypothetical protein [Streptomyces sp. MB09-02B]